MAKEAIKGWLSDLKTFKELINESHKEIARINVELDLVPACVELQ